MKALCWLRACVSSGDRQGQATTQSEEAEDPEDCGFLSQADTLTEGALCLPILACGMIFLMPQATFLTGNFP